MSYIDNEGFFAAPDDTIDWPTGDEPRLCHAAGMALTIAGVIAAGLIVAFATLLIVG